MICYCLSILLNYLLNSLNHTFQSLLAQRRYPYSWKRNWATFQRRYTIPECPVCFTEFGTQSKPLILNRCGHTVCERCAEQLHHRKSIRCPVCLIDTPLRHFDNLSVNKPVLKMIEETKTLPSSKVNGIPVMATVGPACQRAVKPDVDLSSSGGAKKQWLCVTMVLAIWETIHLMFLLNRLMATWFQMDINELRTRSYRSKGWECELCYTDFNDHGIPRVLPCCGNSLCDTCVYKCTGFFDFVKCPFCQMKFQRYVEYLPKNYALQKMIEDGRPLLE